MSKVLHKLEKTIKKKKKLTNLKSEERAASVVVDASAYKASWRSFSQVPPSCFLLRPLETPVSSGTKNSRFGAPIQGTAARPGLLGNNYGVLLSRAQQSFFPTQLVANVAFFPLPDMTYAVTSALLPGLLCPVMLVA